MYVEAGKIHVKTDGRVDRKARKKRTLEDWKEELKWQRDNEKKKDEGEAQEINQERKLQEAGEDRQAREQARE